ncbi:ankyrin [Apiospora sp. TS-2023a]
MVGLLELPLELFYEITGYIDSGQDWKSLAAVDRCFNYLAIKRFWDGLDNDKTLLRLLGSGLTTNLNLQVGDQHELKDETPSFYLEKLGHHNPGQGTVGYAFLPYMEDIHPLDANFIWESFWKPIHVAVRHSHPHIIEILLQHGAWIDEPSVNYCLCDKSTWNQRHYAVGQYTALHVTMCTGQEEIAQLLMSRGASIYVDKAVHRDRYRYGSGHGRVTALHCCAKHGMLSTAKAIMEDEAHKTVLNDRDEYGWTAIMELAHKSHRRQLFGDDSYFAPKRTELLHQACVEGRWEIMVKLVSHGSDPGKPDEQGIQPLELCLLTTEGRYRYKRFYSQSIQDWKDPDEAVEVPKMIDAIKACGMHLEARRDTLIDVLKYALTEPIPALVSLVLDAGIDISEVIWTGRCEGSYTPQLPMARPGSDAFDCRVLYLDTGSFATHLTLMDYACYNSQVSLELPELLDLLFSRGCMNSTDASSYIRALENLCCNIQFEHRWEVRLDWQDNASWLERLCAQILCGQLGIALQSNPTTMRLPLELFSICFNEGDYIILDELAKVVAFSETSFSVEELQYLFDTLTERWYQEVDDPRLDRRFRCLKFLFQLGGVDALLQQSESFEALCYFLWLEHAEEAILHYLDIGGQYHMILHDGRSALYEACTYGCLQLAQRLLDLGADPNKLLIAPEDPADAWRLQCLGSFWGQNNDDGALLRLLLERGGNPFRPGEEHYGIGYPFEVCLKSDDMLEFFRELCRLTINENTDDRDLVDILALACSHGKYLHIQELRSCGGSRVDAVIRENGVLLLQKLLVNLSPSGGERCWCTTTFQQVDHAISTLGLIVRNGGSDILTSSWRLAKKEETTKQRPGEEQEWLHQNIVGEQKISSWRLSKDIDDYSSLEFLKKLLTRPENSTPPPEYSQPGYYGHICEIDYLQSSRIYWCLKQRIKIGSDFDKDSVTILDGRVKRPREMIHEPFIEEDTLHKEQDEYLGKIFVCDCESRLSWEDWQLWF